MVLLALDGNIETELPPMRSARPAEPSSALRFALSRILDELSTRAPPGKGTPDMAILQVSNRARRGRPAAEPWR